MDIPELGSDLMLYSAVVGSILPAIVAAVNRRTWSSEAEVAVSATVSTLVGAGTAFVAGEWDSANVVRSCLVVFFLGQLAYSQVWKPSGITEAMERAGLHQRSRPVSCSRGRPGCGHGCRYEPCGCFPRNRVFESAREMYRTVGEARSWMAVDCSAITELASYLSKLMTLTILFQS